MENAMDRFGVCPGKVPFSKGLYLATPVSQTQLWPELMGLGMDTISKENIDHVLLEILTT